MGWTSFRLNEPVKVWFRKEWGDNYKALDIAIVKRNTLYAAMLNTETNEIFCAVFLLRWSRDVYNFSYKSMTEFSGPVESECPERILKVLTPLNDENDPNNWGREWRERCWENIENRKKIKTGKYIIKAKDPVKFTNGTSFQYFKKIGRSIYACLFDNNQLTTSYRVSLNLKYINYELIEI